MIWLKHKKRNIINKFEIASGFARKKSFFLDSSLAIIKLTLGAILFFAFLANISLAAYEVEIPLPGMTTKTFSDPGAYVKYLFIFGLSLAGFLAVGAIALGGINYMLAGSITSVDKAKGLIIGALSGIALLLCSWLLLTTIDPTLTNLSPQILPIGNIAAPPPAPVNAIGAGAQEYKWIEIPVNQYCSNVLGSGWRTVDSTRCQETSPGLSYDCCGRF